jgi:hypothetical protein
LRNKNEKLLRKKVRNRNTENAGVPRGPAEKTRDEAEWKTAKQKKKNKGGRRGYGLDRAHCAFSRFSGDAGC